MAANDKKRISVTTTRAYWELMDQMVEEGIHLSPGAVVLEALRRLFRDYGYPPFVEYGRWLSPNIAPQKEAEIEKEAEKPPEEPVADLEEPVEEIIEDEDEVVLLYCNSGAHEPGPIPHRKKVQRRGWAMYTCMKCNKETPFLISKAEGAKVESK